MRTGRSLTVCGRGGGSPSRGVYFFGGGASFSGGSPWGGGGWGLGCGIPACTEVDPPPGNRITDACKNITLTVVVRKYFIKHMCFIVLYFHSHAFFLWILLKNAFLYFIF